MEPDDTFALINSYNSEELHPRQVPKALSCNKVNPVPSVPDVSLVFDSYTKGVKFHSNDAHSVGRNDGEEKVNPIDENGPRTLKPTPIAPLPNETYASWRSRAMRIHHEGSLGLSPSNSKIDAVNLRYSDHTSGGVPELTMEDPPQNLAFNQNMNHRNESLLTDMRHFRQFNGKHLTKPPIERNVGNHFKAHPDVTGGDNRSEMFPRENEVLNSTLGTNRRHVFPRQVIADVHEQNISNLVGNQRKYSALDSKISNNATNGLNSLEKRYHPSPSSSKKQYPKDAPDDYNGLHVRSISPSSSKEEGVSKKRDPLRDLYRIVQLQNEQLRSLQSQVEKLLKRSDPTSPQSSHSPKFREKVSACHYVEEGTQTSFQTFDSVASVGVMTSFVGDSDAKSPVVERRKPESSVSSCKCKECGCDKARNGNEIAELHEETIQDLIPDARHVDGIQKNQINRKYVPISVSNRNVRNIHQVIEEETESDESVREQSKLATEMATQTCTAENHSRAVTTRKVQKDKKVVAHENNPKSCALNADIRAVEGSVNSKEGNVKVQTKPHLDSRSQNTRNVFPGDGGHPRLQPHDLRDRNAFLNQNRCSSSAKKQQNDEDMTMTLNGVDIQTVTEPNPSPEPSIHVDIQDYRDFSGEGGSSSSEDGSSLNYSYSSGNESMCSDEDQERALQNGKQGRNVGNHREGEMRNEDENGENAKPGWTFYNNVLGQVNKLLDNQREAPNPAAARTEEGNHVNNPRPQQFAQPATPGGISPHHIQNVYPQAPNHTPQTAVAVPSVEDVREATLQHLRQLGVNLPNERNKYNLFGAMAPIHNASSPRNMDHQDGQRVAADQRGPLGRSPGERQPTETSLKMRGLALKYLSDEQLACHGYAGLKKDSMQQEPSNLPRDPNPNMPPGVIGEVSSSTGFTLYGMNGTNLSFATLRYLERYHLLPGHGNTPGGMWPPPNSMPEDNFMDLVNTRDNNGRNPGHAEYSKEYIEGYRRGANMGVEFQVRNAKVYSSTPANQNDQYIPQHNKYHPKLADSREDMFLAGSRKDALCEGRGPNGVEIRAVDNVKNVIPKQKGRTRQKVPREGNGDVGPSNRPQQRRTDNEVRPQRDSPRDTIQKHRMHNASPKSSNILDISALRQQPKLL